MEMIERIRVENFGPIKQIDIQIRDINVFIGTTSSGKSTVAKLIAIFQNKDILFRANWEKNRELPTNTLIEFRRLLVAYNIDYNIAKDTLIRYELDGLYCEISHGAVISSTFSPYSSIIYTNPVYMPAERVFYSTLSESIFSLITNDVAIPRWLAEFGSRFEKARREISTLDLSFLGASYGFENGEDVISLTNGDSIKLSQASSGIQSIVPLMVVLQAMTEFPNDIEKETSYDLFIVEEPEMNLFPSSQKLLLEFIIQRIKRCSDKVIITTHSPYILTSLDNLVQAENAAELSNKTEEVDALVPQELWVDFEKVSCYFFDAGHCRETLDKELRSLAPSDIDGVSQELGKVYEALLQLSYVKNEL
ncbi:AAA family ATPase [Pedobacter sp. Du54]|uniref:AAA family ATPase n=1 Tax=Pedobacter anseongensis TaxID=3133439 RepID=UPI0030B60262